MLSEVDTSWIKKELLAQNNLGGVKFKYDGEETPRRVELIDNVRYSPHTCPHF
jgi:hypothetical protein